MSKPTNLPTLAEAHEGYRQLSARWDALHAEELELDRRRLELARRLQPGDVAPAAEEFNARTAAVRAIRSMAGLPDVAPPPNSRKALNDIQARLAMVRDAKELLRQEMNSAHRSASDAVMRVAGPALLAAQRAYVLALITAADRWGEFVALREEVVATGAGAGGAMVVPEFRYGEPRYSANEIHGVIRSALAANIIERREVPASFRSE
ncbi:hypothetical protein [Falsiroseomonas sp.]|uniref:hypothetical protein n=1 Tax=Falsiroseomonas sp. TaxID=2870721 RepID=UPI002725C3E8|nr:hypothetical protein [Falsiroseomonas sp.]MDO9502159.1 hypothetical protein [Falsiroseomonas sp.]